MNTETHTFSDETLNAFIDNELDPVEYQHVLEATQVDSALNARICELRRMRELVRFAYRQPPMPASHARRHALPRSGPLHLQRGLAASLLAVVCLSVGWFAHDAYEQRSLAAAPLPPDSFQAARVDRPASNAGRNILMHVSSAEPDRLAAALDTAEDIARAHTGGQDHIILLTNEGGINLLRADLSPYATRVQALINTHPNLTLIACQNGIEKIERQMGARVALLPGTRIGRPAVEEIVSRLREGWTYMKI